MASTQDRKNDDPTVASAKDNAKLEHTAGGITTRDDATDLGVPMLPGKSDEPTGPEDALGTGPKRGDYTGRIGSAVYHPHESLGIADAKPGEQRSVMEAQRPRAEDRGDEAGLKGGTTGDLKR